MKEPRLPVDLRIALIYALFGGIWILSSDFLLAELVTDSDTSTKIQIFKGWSFVAVSALVIFLLLRRELKLRNITEWKLEESQKRFHTAFDDLLEGVQIINRDWRYVYVNEAVSRQGHATRSALVGRTMMDAYPGIEKTEMFATLRDCMENRVTRWMENEFTYPNGRRGWFSLSFQPTLEGVLILSEDITERKQAEEKLRESETRYRYLFETNPQSMWIYDLKSLAFLAVNDAAIAKYGYSREEFLGMTLADIRPPEDLPRLMENLAAQRKALEYSEGWRHRLKDGRLIDVAISSHTINLDQSDAVLVVAQDITERKRAEKKLEQQNLRLKALRDIDTAILASDSVEKIVGAALDHIRELIGCERANLAVIDWEKNEAVNFDVRDTKESAIAKGARVSLDLIQDILRVLSQGQPVLMKDLTLLPDPPPQIKIFIEEGLRSRCILPLFSQGKLIGSFTLSSNVPDYFDEEKINLGREVSNQVAIAITQTRLVDGLREGEERLAGIIGSAMDGVISVDANQNIILANPASEKMFGYTSEQLLGQPLDMLIPISMREAHRGELEQFGRSGETTRSMRSLGEIKGLRANGDEFPIEASISQIEVGGKKIFTVIHRDITVRKQAEEALRANEERYRSIVENLNQAYYEADRDGRFTYCNPGLLLVGGYTEAELLGRSSFRLIAPEHRRRVFDAYKRWMQDKRIVTSMEFLAQVKNGRRFWVEQTSHFEFDHAGTFVKATNILKDIDERKQAEEALRASEERFRTLFEDSPIAVWEEDFSDVKNHLEHLRQQGVENLSAYFAERPDELLKCAELIRITDANRSAMEMYHAKDKEALIENVNQTASEGELTHLSEVLTDISKGKLHGGWEGKDETLTGKSIAINLTWSVIPGYEEDYSKIIVTTVDITERKRAEEAIRLYTEQLQTAGELGRQLASQLNAEKIYEYLGQAVRQLLPDIAAIFISRFAPEEQTITAVYGLQDDELVDVSKLPPLPLSPEGHGSQGNVIRSGKPVIVADLPKKKAGRFNVQEEAEGRETQSAAYAPLIAQDRILGVVQVQSYTPNRFHEEDIELLTLVGNTAAVAIKNAELFAETRQRVRELETVNHISVALRASDNQEHALAIMLEETLNVFDTRHGAISLWDAETETLRDAIARGWLAGITERPIRSGEGVFGTVFASGETYISADFASDPLILPESRSLLPNGWGGASIPIRTNETVLGVLTLAIPTQRVFRREDIRLLETLAEMAGTSLHRMNLNEEVRRRLEQLQALREIDAAITGNFDRHATLDTILTQIIAQLGVSAADVLMFDPKLKALRLEAYKGFIMPLDEIVHVPLETYFAGRAVSEKQIVSADLQSVRLVPEFYVLWQREGFSNYHAVPLIVKDQSIGVLEIYQRTFSAPNKEWFNFLEMLAGQAAIALDNTGLFEGLESANAELMQAYDSTIEGWSHAMDLRDKETEGHTLRVTDLTLKLARAMGASPAELIHIRRGCLLHDIGKMGIPDRILFKPDKLTDEEWTIMRMHPTFAYEMLETIQYLKPAINIPYCHHEKWDGSGYPRGLAGQDIPIEARIFAVVDVWDALTSDRPYRPAWTRERALEHIKEQAGKHFDPEVVYAFLRLTDEERGIGLQSGA